jgi:integrase
VYDRRAGAKTWKTFTGKGALTAAKRWRANATTQVNEGRTIAPSRHTLREAAEAWLEGAKAEPPTILNRSGQPYKPSVLRGYEQDLRNHVLDDLGARRLTDIRRGDIQALIDRLLGKGLSGSRVRNVILPMRVIYRHALERDEVNINPTTHLRLPNGSKPRDRAATLSEAADLLDALPDDLRPIFATAFYAGMRRGELMALRWENIDLAAGTIRVTRSWDEQAGEIEPKSEKGKRTVPITALLRDHLTEHKAATGRDGHDFVFGSIHGRPFTPSNVWRRSRVAWDTANTTRNKKKLSPLVAIGLHEARHTYVSLMHDAGLSLERIGDYVGHSSAYMTERYRHLLAGHEDETRRLVDAYLARSDTAGRVSQIAVA